MMLLIDQGNSRVKWARLDGTELIAGEPLDQSPASLAAALDRHWSELQPRRILLASVASAARRDALVGWMEAHFEARIETIESAAQAFGVSNAYREPSKLGVDRWLALLAAHHHHPGDKVLVGCGTGLTLDALGADGRHLGGLIAPAPGLMRAALAATSQRLAELPPGRIVDCADNTADAIESGTWLACAALVERFHAGINERLGHAPQLIVSGGGAESLIPLLRLEVLRDNDLVLRGLALLAGSR